MIMTLYEYFVEPLSSYVFLKRALVACLALAAGCAPVGVILVLRRMSLMGDALSHSVMPGVAIGYLIAGLSLPIMGLGGFIAGLIVAFLATLVTRYTHLKEDASFVGFYLIALAAGTVIISSKGNAIDLNHILFGNILSVDMPALITVSAITSLTVITFAIIYRPLILECHDPIFMRSMGKSGTLYHIIFMSLVVMNMVSAFQALGTLMALGMMMLPSIAARFWSQTIAGLIIVTFFFALISGYFGLILSFQMNLASGPTIILVAGVIYMGSLLFGNYGSLRHTLFKTNGSGSIEN